MHGATMRILNHSFQSHQLNEQYLFIIYINHVYPACFAVSHKIITENTCAPYSKQPFANASII